MCPCNIAAVNENALRWSGVLGMLALSDCLCAEPSIAVGRAVLGRVEKLRDSSIIRLLLRLWVAARICTRP